MDEFEDIPFVGQNGEPSQGGDEFGDVPVAAGAGQYADLPQATVDQVSAAQVQHPPAPINGPVVSEGARNLAHQMRTLANDMPVGGAMLQGGAAVTDFLNETIGGIPEAIKGMSQGGVLHHENTRLAAQQGTQPHVIGGDGEYLREMVGKVTSEDDGGNLFYSDAEGNYIPVDRKTHVVLKDPRDGELTVFQRNADWDEGGAAAAGRMLIEGMLTEAPTGVMPVAQGARAASREIALSPPALPGAVRGSERAAKAERDLQAFDELNVVPPGIAFSSGPVAGLGKQVSEIPIVGAPMRNSLERAYEGAARSREEIAGAISPHAAQDQVGASLQSGLNRFHNTGIEDVPAAQMRELGIEPASPVQHRDMMSRGAAERMEAAEPIRAAAGGDIVETTRGVPVDAAGTRNQTFAARRTAEDLSDSELGIIIRAPAQQTSFGAKQEALYERAFRMLPDFRKIDGSVNTGRLSATNTRAALHSVDNNIASQIAGQGRLTGELAKRILNPKTHFSLRDLRAIRTEVGRSLSNFGVMEQRLDRGQLKQLYRALSQDIEVGIIDYANRAMILTRESDNAGSKMTIEQARRAGGALKAFRTADRYTRQGMNRMDQFIKVVGASTPEQAAQRLVTATLEGGRGNMKLLETARSALRQEEWNQFSSLVLRNMGMPVASARGISQEVKFSAPTFVTNWTNMDQRSRNALFGAEHARSVDNLFRVANRIANIDALVNTSRTATNAINLSAALATITGIVGGNIALPATVAGAGGALSIALSRPQYARWLTKYIKFRAQALEAPSHLKVTPQMITHVNKLRRLSEQNPDLLPMLQVVENENGIEPEKKDVDLAIGEPVEAN